MDKEVKALSKDHDSGDAQIMAVFEAYKHANEVRLAELEAKGGADPLLDQKLSALDKRLDYLSLKMAHPDAVTDPGSAPSASSERQHYMRYGDTRGLVQPDTKSLNTEVDAQGGYIAPPQLDRLIEARLAEATPMRQIASVRQTSAGLYRKPVAFGASAQWVGEREARTETDIAQLQLLDFPSGELYAMPAATQTLLDDAYADMDDWLAGEVEAAFSAQESAAFVSGDGVHKPKGFLSYTVADESVHNWGTVGSVSGDFTVANPGDQLIDLIHTPKAAYRAQGRFVMNRRTLSTIRKLKDADGRYLWAPGNAGAPSTILGYPVTELENMPDIGEGQPAIAFGDFQRFYLITDRQGARVLRDPYTAKPYVLFYTTKRVGGGIQDFDAVKLMVF